MNLVLTEEHHQLRDVARRFAASPPDRDTWRRLAEDLGVTGLLVPEEHGGADAGAAEMTVVLEELGAALLPVPFLTTSVLAASLLTRLEGTADLLTGIASGDTVVIAAPWWDPERPITTDADGRLHGRLPYVVDGHLADVLLVVTDRREIFAVDATTLSRRTLTTLDLTRGAARIDLDGAAGRPLPCADPSQALETAWNYTAVGLAAEQLGVARKCLETTVEYARTRTQFARPIGSFQAVKHALADLYVDCELAESAVRHAAWAADAAPAELPRAAALALTSMTAFQAADQAIHLHGGIGFTWEHDLHHYYRRAKASQHLLGTPTTHLERLADHLPTPDDAGDLTGDVSGSLT